ncbi:MAG: ribose-phosphate pyrophosphokinase [Candidatus Riflebacteria bacterium]|nr:ribose-phosphate pyrophosphokinase [Candidatus Riflebacteria bacterium]
MTTKRLRVFDGGSNPELALEICRYLDLEPGRSKNIRFSNGEFCPIIEESVRGLDVYVVQTATHPVDSYLVALLILIDALKRASVGRVTAVVPHYFYARQDKKTRGREPLTAKLVANLITKAGADRALFVDLHSSTLQGFFDIPTDHLYALPILAGYFLKKQLERPVVVAPDAGGINRARAMAQRLDASLAVLEKERPEQNQVKVHQLIGEVKGRTAIVMDDMIDTAGTLSEGIRFLATKGVVEFYACCTHAVFSGPATKRLSECPLKELVVTNSVPVPQEKRLPNMTVLSLAGLIGDAILRIHKDQSVSELFK